MEDKQNGKWISGQSNVADVHPFPGYIVQWSLFGWLSFCTICFAAFCVSVSLLYEFLGML